MFWSGSHLDSQPRGRQVRRCLRRLRRVPPPPTGSVAKPPRSGVTPMYNVAVVDWFNEEGSRFKPSLMGSAVFTGAADLEDTLNITDQDGVTVRDALTAINSIGKTDVFPDGDVTRRLAAYAEIHIEQGRELEKHNVSIGLVRPHLGRQQVRVECHWRPGAHRCHRHRRPSGRAAGCGADRGGAARYRRRVRRGAAHQLWAVDRATQLSGGRAARGPHAPGPAF